MAAEPSDGDQIDERLNRWEEARERGEAVSAEQLCRDRPELAPELLRRIQELHGLGPAGAVRSRVEWNFPRSRCRAGNRAPRRPRQARSTSP